MSKNSRPVALLRDSIPALVLVGVCLAFFLGVVRLSFPEGTGLRGMIRADDGAGWSGSGGPSLEAVGISRRHAEAARLTRVVRKVKDKPADDIAWHDARPGMPLTMRHSVQTLAQSSATISFDDETSLVLGENSLIVLRNFDGEEGGTDRRATLVVFGGELRATVGGRGAGTRLAVETPRGTADVGSASADEPARFRVEVRPDSSTSVAVYHGAADVRVGDRTLRVEANEAVDLDRDAPPAKRELPVPPRLGQPPAGARIIFRGLAPPMRFRWRTPDGADSVRFVVTRDPELTDIVAERRTVGDEVVLTSLDPGHYFWSVASVRGGRTGGWAPHRAFVLALDEEAPALAVQWPEGVVREKTCRLTGVTEPGAHVFVGSVPTRSGPDGRFEIEVELTRGANNVVVEAVDDAGNSAYLTRLITALY